LAGSIPLLRAWSDWSAPTLSVAIRVEFQKVGLNIFTIGASTTLLSPLSQIVLAVIERVEVSMMTAETA
jgi:hypothetical protein